MQALYGWAFAMNDALEQQRRLFIPCKRLELPVCRRCPTSHIALANKAMLRAAGMDRCLAGAGEAPPSMEPMQAAPGAIEGQIFRKQTFKSFPLRSTALVTMSASRAAAGQSAASSAGRRKGTAILARRNAPLLALLYSLARRGIPCHMLGRAPLSRKLLALLRQLSIDGRACATLDEVETALDGHVRREAERRDEQEGGGAEYATADLAECVRTLLGVVRDERAQANPHPNLNPNPNPHAHPHPHPHPHPNPNPNPNPNSNQAGDADPKSTPDRKMMMGYNEVRLTQP